MEFMEAIIKKGSKNMIKNAESLEAVYIYIYIVNSLEKKRGDR